MKKRRVRSKDEVVDGGCGGIVNFMATKPHTSFSKSLITEHVTQLQMVESFSNAPYPADPHGLPSIIWLPPPTYTPVQWFLWRRACAIISPCAPARCAQYPLSSHLNVANGRTLSTQSKGALWLRGYDPAISSQS